MQEVSDNEEPVTFFQPSSPYYLTTLYVTLAALALFLCGGILFQISCYKRIRSGPDISKLIRAQHHRGRQIVLAWHIHKLYFHSNSSESNFQPEGCWFLFRTSCVLLLFCLFVCFFVHILFLYQEVQIVKTSTKKWTKKHFRLIYNGSLNSKHDHLWSHLGICWKFATENKAYAITFSDNCICPTVESTSIYKPSMVSQGDFRD